MWLPALYWTKNDSMKQISELQRILFTFLVFFKPTKQPIATLNKFTKVYALQPGSRVLYTE